MKMEDKATTMPTDSDRNNDAAKIYATKTMTIKTVSKTKLITKLKRFKEFILLMVTEKHKKGNIKIVAIIIEITINIK